MNKFLNFLSHLSGPLNKQHWGRRDTQYRFWRFWDCVQDSVVKGNMTLIFFLIAVHNLLCVIFNKIHLSNSRAPNYCVLDIIKLLILTSAVAFSANKLGLVCQPVVLCLTSSKVGFCKLKLFFQIFLVTSF